MRWFLICQSCVVNVVWLCLWIMTADIFQDKVNCGSWVIERIIFSFASRRKEGIREDNLVFSLILTLRQVSVLRRWLVCNPVASRGHSRKRCGTHLSALDTIINKALKEGAFHMKRMQKPAQLSSVENISRAAFLQQQRLLVKYKDWNAYTPIQRKSVAPVKSEGYL